VRRTVGSADLELIEIFDNVVFDELIAQMRVHSGDEEGQYVYHHHCIGHRGPCGNTYVREEELVRQFGEVLMQIRIPHELAGKLAMVLRESRADKEKFVRASTLRLQQQQMLLPSKLDRVYEDRLSDAISDELWTTKASELQEELRRVRTEMERYEGAARRTRRPDSRF